MKYLTKSVSKVKGAFYAMTLAMLAPMGTFCVNTNVDTNTVLTGVLDVIFDVARYVGIVLCVSGLFMLILAYKDDNADGQSRAVRLVVVSLVLLGLKTLVKLTGII